MEIIDEWINSDINCTKNRKYCLFYKNKFFKHLIFNPLIEH